jgi:competence protein ComEC
LTAEPSGPATASRARPHRARGWLVCLAVPFLVASPSRSAAAPQPTPVVEWTMVNVSSATAQADAHLIRLPDGGFQLIDAGDNEGRLVRYLRRRGVTRLERVYISHLHKDHYGALTGLVQAGIAISEVYVNYPDRSVCDSEIPWGCDFPHIEQTMASLREKKTSIVEVKPGDIVYSKDGVRLQVLYAFNGLNSPAGRTDVNDTSVIMALEYGRTRVLFAGDLNAALGGYLAEHADDIRAEILKVPHHGTEGVAPSSFFDRVGAAVAMVPSPRGLWLSERSSRVRRYFEQKGTRTYVSGIDGHVTVKIRQDGYSVETARGSRGRS